MRTRTRLTTPPGQEPVEEVGRPTAARERYTPGLALPTEPHVPGRHRGAVTWVVAVAVAAGLVYGGFRVATRGQYEDPALSDAPTEEPSAERPVTDPGG